MLVSLSVVRAVEEVVCSSVLVDESESELKMDDDMVSVVLDARLMEVLSAAETVRVLPSKTVVYGSADRDSVVTSPCESVAIKTRTDSVDDEDSGMSELEV